MVLTVSLVIDESLTRVELAAGLGADQVYIGSLDGSPAGNVGGCAEGFFVREEVGVETGNVTEFSDRGFYRKSAFIISLNGLDRTYRQWCTSPCR